MQTRPRTCGTLGWAFSAVTVGGIVALSAVFAVGQDANAPAEPNAATTQPADANDIVVLTNAPRDIDPNENLSPEAIDMTPAERTVVAAVRDRDTSLFHNAMYVLLDRARRLEPLTADELEALEEPIYAKMMRHPEQYRGQPIQLDIYVMTRHRLVAGENMPIKPGVKKGDVIWQLGCFVAGKDMNVSRAMPMTIFSVVDPNKALGTPIESDTGQTLGHYRRARVACLFYKVYKGTDREGKQRTYPAAVAWQFVDRGKVDVGWSPYQVFGMVVVGLLGLALLYRMMRRYRNYTRKSGRDRAKYIPLREEQGQKQSGDDEQQSRDDEQEDEPVDGPVDPDLRSAAEEHIRNVRSEKSDEQDDLR
jgi:hypothetical protein